MCLRFVKVIIAFVMSSEQDNCGSWCLVTCLVASSTELKKLWRSVAVDGMDERKIEDYLDKQGITSMEDVGVKKVVDL